MSCLPSRCHIRQKTVWLTKEKAQYIVKSPPALLAMLISTPKVQCTVSASGFSTGYQSSAEAMTFLGKQC